VEDALVKLVLIVPFLNEERYLPTFLESIVAQSRAPDELILVDDGSDDRSPELAEQFAAQHPYARAYMRPARSREHDRLARAPELQAFLWGAERVDPGWDVLAKLDGDLRLTPGVLAQVENKMRADPRLGITGPYLSIRDSDGGFVRERCPPYHVRGAVKFYRRECWDQIAPLPAMLGWDTIDEVTARHHGWRTASFAVDHRDPLHLRSTGAVDGRLRAFRRWGACAYAIGDHPLWIALGAARRIRERPWLLAAGAYLAGWNEARRRGATRAAPAVRRYVRQEQIARVRASIARSASRIG
jgi:poly-beta-1,6-N-acetyl-D-glucosamine synthase